MKKIILILTCLIANVTLAQEETTTIYLMRHVEKAADGTADPGISEAGKERAKKFGDYLKDKGVDIYYMTKYKRAVETAAAVNANVMFPPTEGTSTNITMKVYEPMTFSLKQLVQDNKGKSIVVVGHSNTIPTHVNNLLGDKKYPDMQESEYGNLYIVKITGDNISVELLEL